ncbi:cytochrome P450 [Raineyella antarctica]|uniref:cytochrome P450 n=1 Tax=Raineyella antarctica TaxID=1577474 RepID=UPI001FE00629|nr:cytochrome P450 [Raineyella antarctica]
MSADWDPGSPDVHRDQRVAYDRQRTTCPVAHDGSGTWTLFAHGDVVAAANDAKTFSSRVSSHLNVPNGMDGDEHAAYRGIVERYMGPDRVEALAPTCHAIAADVIASTPRHEVFRAVTLGARFAVRAQSAWLGWPAQLEDTLVEWMADNHAATRSGDHVLTAQVAQRFDTIIRSLIDRARRTPGDDVTTQLLAERVDGRHLTEEEVVSILRNWTAGDLGSIAVSLGVVVHFLASHPDLQHQLRTAAVAGDRPVLEAAVEEILRIDDPFVANRRLATVDVEVAGRTIRAGERVVLNWTAANRDPAVLGDPDAYDPPAHAADNLVFGTGPHACPGRALSLMELAVATSELLVATSRIEHAPGQEAVRETPPVGGWSRVPVLLG